VFDDPISSLDNEVMFIVSSLIKELTDTINSKDRQKLDLPVNVKQVFVLTHNIFFHKEVTYNCKRDSNNLLNDETFWLIRKNGIKSTAERQKCNPIKTSYELLWNEIRSETRNCATIQNTMRRILENYYVKLGNIQMSKFVNLFGESCEKSICISLCSWMHSGSHSVFDDDYCTTIDETMVCKYLEVFKQIFIKSGHEAHYNMMMQI